MSKSIAPTGIKGISLIELIIATAIVSIIAALVAPAYSSYRTRTHRLNGESCLLDLARRQEAYFARNNQYSGDLKALGYATSGMVGCATTDQYHLALEPSDAGHCPLTYCYRASATPQGAQAKGEALYLSYDASQPDTDRRMKKERDMPGSGMPWD